ncbi:bolA-like protein 2 [Copidosoma floridanum]|uniref:bolA-like protein 2 n=1 Tax=Copidosoma floridanum TaxID=29053 RepID=UPI0006C96044|nr:bolA-like protein 2 [Copidosoma floridanum]
MPYSTEDLRKKLQEELEPVHLEVVDDSDGCGAKFTVLIVSEKFEGKSLLQRHRLVNSTLQEELKSIHAFTQKTLTPEQWEAESKQQA